MSQLQNFPAEPTVFRPRRPAPPLKVAIIHYWLINMRGGEKVLEALCELYPDADIFTHVYEPNKVSQAIREKNVRTTFIQRLPLAKKHYQKYLPLMPLALEQLDLSAYDLVISSESGPAKGVIVRPDALHVCYCHTPMRYIWDHYPQYRKSAGFLTRMMMPGLAHTLRQWDVTSAARVDHFVANSTAVARRIRKYWRRDSEVIPPPVDVSKFTAGESRDDFYLYVGELVPYKRADLAVIACTMLERRLIVIGDGSEAARLKRMAGPTVEFVGRVPDKLLQEHYARCRALLFPAEEDFGIVPVEAMASGAPVIAFGRGGSEDTVIDRVTGILFGEQTAAGMLAAIIRFELEEDIFDPQQIAAHTQQFEREHFMKRFDDLVRTLLGQKAKSLTVPAERKRAAAALALAARALVPAE
jgi:glycosyltransferase involved in cell wall biosynthesis